MNWVKLNQELRNTVETGKIIYGAEQVKKTCLIGEPKLLIISSTINKQYYDLFKHYTKLLNIMLIEHPEGSTELGSICGKPFGISVLAITDEGKSSIFKVIEDSKTETKEEKKVVAKKVKKEEKKKEKEVKEKKKQAKETLEKVKTEKVEEEVPITEDKLFKDIIKIKKK